MKRPYGTGQLYEKSGSYYGRWRTPDGRRLNRASVRSVRLTTATASPSTRRDRVYVARGSKCSLVAAASVKRSIVCSGMRVLGEAAPS